ncbi:SPL family radical SAM protein [Raoultibacter timonensis]|uniref:Radical SAM protein n=1 Tax=Raoultibacter timonensis TaxID=1907662 RepID=A0ABN6MGZ7_9ACTN|nr:radical SAM protein [Raoultibacter timonensis]BDE97234.1 radical SAM protein [Raoultibacter timonensis]BDF51837.1 radical SAM protein [Raoultibacter timonensis]
MVRMIPAKTILQKSRYEPSEWFGIDYVMNLYRGCTHGCIYCDSRSNCYGIKDFTEVQVKEGTDVLLAKSLHAKKSSGIISTGIIADCYNPYEEEFGVTRRALEIIADCRFGADVNTKSPLVTRDIDVLERVAWARSANVRFTITAADDDLARTIEPHAPSSSERFAAMKEISDSGLFTGVMLTPLVPFVTDTAENIESLVELAHDNGARFIYTLGGISIRDGQKEYFMSKLKAMSPKLAKRFRDTYGSSYFCYSLELNNILALLRERCDKAGILYRMDDIIHASQNHTEQEQTSLF